MMRRMPRENKLKFYDCKTAPSPRRVRIFMAEKGIEIETVQVDLKAGEQFSDEFRSINPDCVVPALQLDDGSCLSEVLAICDYLESLHPEPPLLGKNPLERARILMWNGKSEQQGLWATANAFRNAARGLADRAITGPVPYAQIPELAQRGRDQVKQFFYRLDRQLSANDFVAGERFSVADITAMVTSDFAARLDIPIPEDTAHTRRWYESVATRPSYAA